MKTRFIKLTELFDIAWCYFTLPKQVKNLPPGPTPYWTGTKMKQRHGFKKFVDLQDTTLKTEPADVFVINAHSGGTQFLEQPFLAGSKIIKFVPKFTLNATLIQLWKQKFFANFDYSPYSKNYELENFQKRYLKAFVNEQNEILWQQTFEQEKLFFDQTWVDHQKFLNQETNYLWWNPEQRESFIKEYQLDPDIPGIDLKITEEKQFELYDVFALIRLGKPNYCWAWTGMVVCDRAKEQYDLNDFPIAKLVAKANSHTWLKFQGPLENYFGDCSCTIDNDQNHAYHFDQSLGKLIELTIRFKKSKNKAEKSYYIVAKGTNPDFPVYKMAIEAFEGIENYLGKTYYDQAYLASLRNQGPFKEIAELSGASIHYDQLYWSAEQILQPDWTKVQKLKKVKLQS